MADVLPEFVANLPNEVASLKHLLDTRDLAGLQEAVYQLKGGGGSYGFQNLSDAAAIAERSLKSHASIAIIKSEVESLIDLIRRVRDFSPT